MKKGENSPLIYLLRLTDSPTSENLLSSSKSDIRSGLYLVLPHANGNEAVSVHHAYMLYWPEETTWDDKAISSVRRNRVTFMR